MAPHGFRPYRPGKHGSAPGVFAVSTSGASQRSTGSDHIGLTNKTAPQEFRPYRLGEHASAPRIPAVPTSHLSRQSGAAAEGRFRSTTGNDRADIHRHETAP